LAMRIKEAQEIRAVRWRFQWYLLAPC